MAQSNDIFEDFPRYILPASSDWDTYIPPENLLPRGARVIHLDDGSEVLTSDRSSLKLKSTDVEVVKLTSFALFPELPLELQLKIWHYAACVSRIVEVKLEVWYQVDDYGMTIQCCDHHRISPKPSLIHTSVDARRQAIAIFPATSSKVKIHINPDADCLLMKMDDLIEYYNSDRPNIDFTSVGYLAIKNYDLNDGDFYFHYTARLFAKQVANYVNLK